MKKITLLTVAVALMSVACRQEDDVLTNQDVINLKIIKENRELRKNTNNDSIFMNINKNDDLVLPPRK